MVFPQGEFPFSTEAIRHRWEQELADPDIECFVILDADLSVAGFAAVQGNLLLHFGTALGLWGSGLAGAAHGEVLAYWRAEGYWRGWLRVLEHTLRARRFYERCGWQQKGDRDRSGFAPFPMLLTYEVDLSTPPKRSRALHAGDACGYRCRADGR